MGDWVEVTLTKFGEEQAGDGVLRVQEGNGGQGFEFRAGEAQRVTRAFDWERVLKPWHINGHALFQVVVLPDLSEPITEENVNDTVTVVMGTEEFGGGQ